MAWGDANNIDTTNLDAGTDSPALARADLKAALDEITAIINGRGTASGVASLDTLSRVPVSQLQHSVASSFPDATNLVVGYQCYRSDLGEWYTLMDATDWGGTGKAWVGNSIIPWAFGSNTTSGVAQTRSLDTYGKAGPSSSTHGIYLDSDCLIVSATGISKQAVTGTADLRVGATTKLTLTFTSETTKAMSLGTTNFVEVASGGILNAEMTHSAGTLDDFVYCGTMRRVVAA